MIFNSTVGEKCSYQFKNGINIVIDSSGIMVVLNWDGITDDEFKNVSEGELKVKCFVKGQVAFLLLKLGSLNWMDVAFNVHATGIVKPEDFPEIEDGQGYGLHILLIAAEDNVVKFNRIVGLDSKFSRKLRKVFLEQLAGDYDAFDYQVTASNVMQAYQTKELVNMADF